ncbi:hypothetical protein GUITHDRAFT_120603 [Guillardia theta CCMP2712]|uniref:Uncharacterized protein n=1 Tax=Guillardia theta (strain CCMP2712) TaxID=905079 RepID=L1IBB2_GUITC|nr:hypothetical protein GUITHDRAFT_120603 [Guillardia theta CCMP2712]EKX33204.1 hypothetical protein GUITHDRAFT_120603 [Guillardia theta CCMP2712]|eukprot:XP_005820184.1 hypothetical protein GUITHDRAFT_120603 [Guillardia theta CCMP2712]
MSLAMAHEKTRAVSSPDRQYKTMISNISRAINTSSLLIEPDDMMVKRKFVMVDDRATRSPSSVWDVGDVQSKAYRRKRREQSSKLLFYMLFIHSSS